jgi:biotin operon repressor
MAWDEYIAVRNSNLYEHKGLAKPLLSLIALLVIGEPEEDEQGKPKTERDPDAGYCTATQDYLAAQLGCSRKEVNVLIQTFEDDGWLIIETYRNRRGHLRNRYCFAPQTPQQLENHRMLKDEQGEYIREKGQGQSADTLELV